MNFTEKRKRELDWNMFGGYQCFNRSLTPLNSVRVIRGQGREIAFATKEVTDSYRIARISDNEMVGMINRGECPIDYPHKIYRV